MPDEVLFAYFFITVYIAFWIVMGYYLRQTRDPDAPRTSAERREAMKKEGWTGIAIVVLTPIEIIIIIIYAFFPALLSWTFLFIIPEIVRWMGLIFTLLVIPLVVWVHRALGKAYSYALETKVQQNLITSGPFRRIRHPLYSAYTLFNLGMVLLTMNIPLTVFAIIGIPITYSRMRDEELMMIEKFGSEYEEYMKQTGRIFPKF